VQRADILSDDDLAPVRAGFSAATTATTQMAKQNANVRIDNRIFMASSSEPSGALIEAAEIEELCQCVIVGISNQLSFFVVKNDI
jgi:hypothetical protein